MIKKPVIFKQDKHTLWIEDSEGQRIAMMDRYAWSSSDETLQDSIECLNFPHADRERAAEANATQIAEFDHMVEAINNFGGSQ
jgi:hypothetical protein